MRKEHIFSCYVVAFRSETIYQYFQTSPRGQLVCFYFVFPLRTYNLQLAIVFLHEVFLSVLSLKLKRVYVFM